MGKGAMGKGSEGSGSPSAPERQYEEPNSLDMTSEFHRTFQCPVLQVSTARQRHQPLTSVPYLIIESPLSEQDLFPTVPSKVSYSSVRTLI